MMQNITLKEPPASTQVKKSGVVFRKRGKVKTTQQRVVLTKDNWLHIYDISDDLTEPSFTLEEMIKGDTKKILDWSKPRYSL